MLVESPCFQENGKIILNILIKNLRILMLEYNTYKSFLLNLFYFIPTIEIINLEEKTHCLDF